MCVDGYVVQMHHPWSFVCSSPSVAIGGGIKTVVVREFAAEYFLVAHKVEDVDWTEQVVRLGTRSCHVLKCTVEEACVHYFSCIGPVDPATVLRELVCFRFMVTHLGMSAVWLGYVPLSVPVWKQNVCSLTWYSLGAGFKFDLPLHMGSQDKQVLWTGERVEVSADRMKALYEQGQSWPGPVR